MGDQKNNLKNFVKKKKCKKKIVKKNEGQKKIR